MGHGRANKRCGICLMDQNVTANRQIEGRRIDKVLCGAFAKLNVRVACAARAAARGAEGVAITINTDDSAVRTDHFRGQKRDVACTAAEIEDAHPRRDAGLAQKALGNWLQNACVKYQATDLGRGMAEETQQMVHRKLS